MYNDQAAELLGLEPRGRRTAIRRRGQRRRWRTCPLAPSLKELFESGRTAHDEIHLTGPRILVVNQGPAVGPGSPGAPARPGGVRHRGHHPRPHGNRVAGQRAGNHADALRCPPRPDPRARQPAAHHGFPDGTGPRREEALDFATKDLELSQQLTDDMVEFRRRARAERPDHGQGGRGPRARRGTDSTPTASGPAVTGLAVQDLVTILGNLLDNAIDAAADGAAAEAGGADRGDDAAVRWTSRWRIAGPGIDPAGGGRRLPARLQHQGAGPVRARPWPGPGAPGRAAPGRYHDNHQPGGALFRVTLPTLRPHGRWPPPQRAQHLRAAQARPPAHRGQR